MKFLHYVLINFMLIFVNSLGCTSTTAQRSAVVVSLSCSELMARATANASSTSTALSIDFVVDGVAPHMYVQPSSVRTVRVPDNGDGDVLSMKRDEQRISNTSNTAACSVQVNQIITFFHLNDIVEKKMP